MSMMKGPWQAIAAIAAAAGCWLTATNGLAQALPPPAQRPIQGVFGGAPKSEGLGVSLSTSEAYDDNQIGAGIGPVDPRTQESGPFDEFAAAVVFKRNVRQVSFGVDGQSALRYYPALQNLASVSHAVTGRFAAQLDRTQLSFLQTAEYAPFYSYSTLPQLFDAQPGELPAGPPDQILVRRLALITASSGVLSQTLGRSTLSLSGTTQRTDFLDEAGNGLRADSAMGRFVYHLTRDVGLVAGYEYQRGRYELNPATIQTVEFHNIDVGLDYNHALSRSRRTTVGFVTGMTAVHDASGAPQYRLTGEGRVSREIGRTWHAAASYHRGANLIAGFGQPIFSNSVALSVGGAITSRLTLSTNAGYSKGELTAITVQNTTDNYTGSARLQFALSRLMALSGEYVYYRYRFDRPVGLPDGIQQQFNRQSARIGLTVWLPLFR